MDWKKLSWSFTKIVMNLTEDSYVYLSRLVPYLLGD